MISSNKKVVQILVQECLKAGINHVVCSPGSRNAPIVIAFDEHPLINCKVIHDERSAAFIAMGMAQQLNQPVAVVCTSGSALLNYYPAVAEAFYQRIPLVVISADRPEKWINQGDGQTIVQRGVYANHIDAEIAISEKDNATVVANELEVIFDQLFDPSRGPIHINIEVDEPLYGTETIEEKEIESKKYQLPITQLSEDERDLLKTAISKTKKMVLIGQMPLDELFHNQLMELSSDSSVAILVENTSNLVSQKWIHCIDRTLNLISEEDLKDFVPDVLITFGGAIVSKRIKAFLRKNQPQIHFKVGFDFPEMNTYELLSHSFQVKNAYFLSEWNALKNEIPTSNFGVKWKQLDFFAQEKAKLFLEKVAFSDLKVIETILDFVPDASHLHMANSSVVRYCQLFDPIKGVHYWSNRGTSGIDGSTSTAVGAALIKTNEIHTLITGDVSFFYDSNALWNNYKIPNLRIFLINNGGGGIFNIIPGPRSSKQNSKYFEAKHSFSAEYVCKGFDVEYFLAKNLDELESQMEAFYRYSETGGIKLMEIVTSDCYNHVILDNYFEFCKS